MARENWMNKVPEGCYTIKQLISLTGKSRMAVWNKLLKLKVPYTIKQGERNLTYKEYHWSGNINEEVKNEN